LVLTVDVQMPEIGDPQEAVAESMKKVSGLLRKIVHLNLSEGGRPVAWPVRADGSRSYLGGPGGTIGRSIREASGDTWAEVSSNLPYSAVHQFGGMPKPRVSERSRKYFWRMFYETGNEKWKWMALSRKTQFAVNIQARPYMQLTEGDVAEIAAMVGLDISASIFLNDTSLASSLT
jgi:phage gpG-like protein